MLLRQRGIITTDDVDYLDNLQIAHDEWANEGRYKEGRYKPILIVKVKEQEFIRVLNSALPPEERI